MWVTHTPKPMTPNYSYSGSFQGRSLRKSDFNPKELKSLDLTDTTTKHMLSEKLAQRWSLSKGSLKVRTNLYF